ncbi:tyrosine-type recombinase/integrase [Hungatella hathewayi]
MPLSQLLQLEFQEDTKQLRKQLEEELAECSEVGSTYRNKVEIFMIECGIWHISELNYPLRQEFQQFLIGQMKPACYPIYVKAFDRIKQHSIYSQMRVVNSRRVQLKYENNVLFLPYHPNQELVRRLDKAQRKDELAWDFGKKAPEKMKRQIFHILNYFLEQDKNRETLRNHMNFLRVFYDFCVEEVIEDIELLELQQYQKYVEAARQETQAVKRIGIIDLCRKILFMQAEEIHWKAHIWYMERFYFQPGRIDLSNPVLTLSFIEVTHKRNRELLKKYMRYGLGITNLTIANLRSEMYQVRNLLMELTQEETTDICAVTSEQMEAYFREKQERKVHPATFNKMVMSIQHFFDFLLVRGYIEKVPFCAEYYLKKEVMLHHDRSVELEVSREILRKLYLFPENIRLMYLHLWSIGLRISEVCTLKGDAYYIQGRDAWIQVYQIKMKNYKRIPIPDALYRLMKEYLKKYQIGPKDYVFQNQKEGAYQSATFRKIMLKCCAENGIQDGEYLFQSHDYRHSIATMFYDSGVSLQGIRDYLGHTYEEMTCQYLDYMPRKLANANDEYFNKHNSLAASLKKRGE